MHIPCNLLDYINKVPPEYSQSVEQYHTTPREMAKYIAVILMAVLLIGSLAVSDWTVVYIPNNM